MSKLPVSMKRAFAQPSFMTAVVVLGLSAIILNSVNLKWTKLPVPLSVSSLSRGIPQQIGHWAMVSIDHPIDSATEEVLGTSQYVFRDYVDDRKVSPAEIEELKTVPAGKRDLMLSKLQSGNPLAVMRVSVTYYTGLVDTVAHVPDRCYVADGFEIKQHQTKHATVGQYADGTPRSLDYSYLTFEDQTGLGQRVQRVSRNVGYVFHCDGKYLSSANEVRLQLQGLFEPYAYYAKVEMMTVAQDPEFSDSPATAAGQDDSSAAMEDFLTQALPEFEKCLGDWKSLHKK